MKSSLLGYQDQHGYLRGLASDNFKITGQYYRKQVQHNRQQQHKYQDNKTTITLQSMHVYIGPPRVTKRYYEISKSS